MRDDFYDEVFLIAVIDPFLMNDTIECNDDVWNNVEFVIILCTSRAILPTPGD